MKINPLVVMESMQWGFNHSRCPLCAGWNCGPNGETDHAHTNDCPYPKAIAATTELVEAAEEALSGLAFFGLSTQRLVNALENFKESP